MIPPAAHLTGGTTGKFIVVEGNIGPVDDGMASMLPSRLRRWQMSQRQRKPWTEDRKRQAVDLYETGVSMHAVARAMVTSVRHVHRVLNERGVVRSKSDLYRGDGNPAWKDGRRVVGGYVYLYRPESPMATEAGYVAEHRLVVSESVGRPLKRGEVVHHKNGDKADNRLENLELFASNAEHLRHELTGRCPEWTEDGKRRLREARNRGRG